MSGGKKTLHAQGWAVAHKSTQIPEWIEATPRVARQVGERGIDVTQVGHRAGKPVFFVPGWVKEIEKMQLASSANWGTKLHTLSGPTLDAIAVIRHDPSRLDALMAVRLLNGDEGFRDMVAEFASQDACAAAGVLFPEDKR